MSDVTYVGLSSPLWSTNANDQRGSGGKAGSMSIVVVIAITAVTAYLAVVAAQYEVHRMMVRRLRPAPVVTGRPHLRLVVDNTGPARLAPVTRLRADHDQPSATA